MAKGLVDENLLGVLSEIGMHQANYSRKPKIIFFDWPDSGDIQSVEAACFYDGEFHRSIPGSGAMCLGGLLSLAVLQGEPPKTWSGVKSINVYHPSGETKVAVTWKMNAGSYQIQTTEFQTPVQLLMAGQAIAH